MNRRGAGVAFIALSLIVRESPGVSLVLAIAGIGYLIWEEFPDRLHWRGRTTILLVIALIAIMLIALVLFLNLGPAAPPPSVR
jgi:hypothetical protein